MTSQNLWSRYDRHLVGIAPAYCLELKLKRQRSVELFAKKLNRLVYENVRTIISLPIKRIYATSHSSQ